MGNERAVVEGAFALDRRVNLPWCIANEWIALEDHIRDVRVEEQPRQSRHALDVRSIKRESVVRKVLAIGALCTDNSHAHIAMLNPRRALVSEEHQLATSWCVFKE